MNIIIKATPLDHMVITSHCTDYSLTVSTCPLREPFFFLEKEKLINLKLTVFFTLPRSCQKQLELTALAYSQKFENIFAPSCLVPKKM